MSFPLTAGRRADNSSNISLFKEAACRVHGGEFLPVLPVISQRQPPQSRAFVSATLLLPRRSTGAASPFVVEHSRSCGPFAAELFSFSLRGLLSCRSCESFAAGAASR